MRHPNPQFPSELLSEPFSTRYEYFKEGFTLNHPRIREAFDTIIREGRYASQQQVINVVGPTGVGKTKLSRFLIGHCYKEFDTAQKFVTEVPAILIEAPVHGLSRFPWKDLYQRMLLALHEPDIWPKYHYQEAENDGYGRSFSTRHRTEADVRRDLEDRIRDLQTKRIIIDEAQHIFKYGGRTGEKNLDLLKNLGNTTRCQFILIGTYESMFSIEWSAQLSRRTHNYQFSHYRIGDPQDMKAFEASYIGLLSHIPSELDEQLVGDTESIYYGCCGCVGILKEWLERAFLRSESIGVLLKQHLEETALSNRALLRIAEENNEGEHFFSEPSHSELKKIFTSTNQAAVVSVASPPERKRGRRKPGERVPGRDPVPV